jgi:hypothetical protein
MLLMKNKNLLDITNGSKERLKNSSCKKNSSKETKKEREEKKKKARSSKSTLQIHLKKK